MKISSKGVYALEAMIELASREHGNYVSIPEIAESRNKSVKYLEQVFNMLKAADLIISVRGKGGGYKLKRSAEKITAKDIILATEGELEPVQCLSEGCTRENACKTKPIWLGMQNELYQVLQNNTLADLVKKYEEVRA